MHMMENSEKTPDEKPSPEQNRHPSRGSNLPLFTNETRTIIWGLQARAVQVLLHEEVISQGIIVTSNHQRLGKCVFFYNWDLRLLFDWSSTTDIAITSYFWNSPKAAWDSLYSSCPASDRYDYQQDIEAKSVSQPKMVTKAWNDQASAISTRGIS